MLRAAKGGIITAMHRDFESLHVNVYTLLRDLGVSADHTQFFYTAYAVALVADQPLRGLFFAPLVLQPAAQLYCVSISAVRSAVRRTAEEASRGGRLYQQPAQRVEEEKKLNQQPEAFV